MFLGRQKEINQLYSLYESNDFQFGIVHGRRRVGKTTLLKESIKNKRALYLLAQQANAKMNLELFSKAYGSFKNIGEVVFDSFLSLFRAMFEEENIIVIIDEFTYLTEVDPSFESMLQGLIDTYKETSTIKLIISGSEVGMFHNLFSHSKPLFGRHTFTLHLKECDYYESSLYYPKFASEDKVRAFAIFGGLPYYLVQIDDALSIKDNVCKLVISENARFANEVEMLLTTELRSIQEYQSVLQAIHSGSTKLAQIDTKSRINNTGKTTKYVNKLIELEILEKEYRFLDGPNSRKHLYRIKNNFIAFYYRFIWRNLSSRTIMEPVDFYNTYVEEHLEHYISLRFEKICEQYLIRNFKQRHGQIITNIGRYWYNDALRKEDIEIDVCVKTEKQVHIYECKWTSLRVDENTILDLKQKGDSLSASRYGAFSKRGFDPEILQEGYDLVTLNDLFNY